MQSKNTKKWWALFALSLGVFMGLLDITVVNVALPTMVKSFSATFNDLQWVVNAYTIAFSVVLLVVSKLGDMYGRKKVVLISMLVFVIASAVNGLATNLLVLDIGRVVQAFGGAGLMTLSMALVASNFEGAQRGTALGILGSVMGLSTVSGPLIGGLLVESFGWPAIFYVNVPIGIIAAILIWVTIDETPSYGKGQKIDWLGMFLSTAAIFFAVYGLVEKENHPHLPWTNLGIAAWLVAAGAFLLIFILVETRSGHPMMNLKLFKNANFVGSVIVAFALGSAVYASNIYLTSLMQNYMGYSAFDTGVRQLTMTVWSLILGPVTGYLGAKYSKRKIISASLLLAGIGFLLLANAMTTKLTYMQLVPTLVMLGITNGLVNPMLNTAGLEGAAPKEIGMVSGLLNVFRQLGTSFGIVILGLAQTNHYDQYLNAHFSFPQAPVAMVENLKQILIQAGPFSGHTIAYSAKLSELPFAKSLQGVVWNAYCSGMRGLAYTAMAIVVIGAVGAFCLLKDYAKSK